MHLLAILHVAITIPAWDLHQIATVMQIVIFMETVALMSIPAALRKVIYIYIQ